MAEETEGENTGGAAEDGRAVEQVAGARPAGERAPGYAALRYEVDAKSAEVELLRDELAGVMADLDLMLGFVCDGLPVRVESVAYKRRWRLAGLGIRPAEHILRARSEQAAAVSQEDAPRQRSYQHDRVRNLLREVQFAVDSLDKRAGAAEQGQGKWQERALDLMVQRDEARAEERRLAFALSVLEAQWRQLAKDNGEHYDRTAAKYEHGKAVVYAAAADELHGLLNPPQEPAEAPGVTVS